MASKGQTRSHRPQPAHRIELIAGAWPFFPSAAGHPSFRHRPHFLQIVSSMLRRRKECTFSFSTHGARLTISEGSSASSSSRTAASVALMS